MDDNHDDDWAKAAREAEELIVDLAFPQGLFGVPKLCMRVNAWELAYDMPSKAIH